MVEELFIKDLTISCRLLNAHNEHEVNDGGGTKAFAKSRMREKKSADIESSNKVISCTIRTQTHTAAIIGGFCYLSATQ